MTSNPPIGPEIGDEVAVPALKEWAAVVHALLEGEQIVDLRKGGLREDGRHFDVPARRLWLYPTAEHQRPELLKAAYRHWTDLADAAPVGTAITLSAWADIVDIATVTEPEHLAALDSKSVWTDDYAQSRLKWKRRDPLWVLGAARPPPRRAHHRSVAGLLRRMHLVGAARRPPRRDAGRVRARAQRRRVRGEAQGRPRRATSRRVAIAPADAWQEHHHTTRNRNAHAVTPSRRAAFVYSTCSLTSSGMSSVSHARNHCSWVRNG